MAIKLLANITRPENPVVIQEMARCSVFWSPARHLTRRIPDIGEKLQQTQPRRAQEGGRKHPAGRSGFSEGSLGQGETAAIAPEVNSSFVS